MAPDLSRIALDAGILGGKPTVRGTRVPVELVLRHLASAPSLSDLFEAFPRLTSEDVRACLAYAEARVRGEEVYPVVSA